MMMKKILLMVAAVSAIAVAEAPQEAVTLRMNLEKGQAYASKVNVQVDFSGQTVNVTSKSITTVKSAENGVFVLESAQSEMMIDMGGGQTMEQPDSTLTITQNAMGKILKVEGDMVTEEASRLMNAFNFFYPEKAVKAGDKWETTIAADKDLGTRELTIKYEMVEVKDWKGKKVAVLKVDHTESGEMPISVSGTVAVEIKTGMPMMMDLAFKNMPQMGMTFDGTWKTEAIL
jgi:hypothetical protein